MLVFDEKGQLSSGEHAAIKVCGLDETVRNVYVEIKGFSQINAGKLTGPDGNEMDTEAFLASLKIVATADFGDAKGSVFKEGEAVPFRVVNNEIW